MKTICFVVPNFPAVSETFVTNQIIALKEKGYQVFVLTHNLEDVKQSTQEQLLAKHDILKDIVVIDYNISTSKTKRLLFGLLHIVKYFKYWVRTPHVSIRHRFINLPYLLNFYAKLRHVDVFHIQFAVGGIGIAEMTENGLLKAKVITTFHGYDAHYVSEKGLKRLQDRYRILFNISCHVTVNTPYLAPKVVELGCKKNKIEVISMGIDMTYFKSNLQKELSTKNEVRLISIGRLIAFKGFKYAIEAIKLLVNKGVQVHYTIVGEGHFFNRLQEQIQSLGLEKQIKLVGKKNQDEIHSLLESHHIYLMSSITNSKGRTETQGVVSAEAQAMGLPVIAFNAGGVPYTLLDTETGFLVPEKDVEAYAQAILDLISDPFRYKKMSLKAREFVVEAFSNELMAERFMALYA